MNSYVWRKKSKKSYLPLNGITPLSVSDKKTTLPWLALAALLTVEVFIYGSYTILAHLCLVKGKLPFHGSTVVLFIEMMKITISIVLLLPQMGKRTLSLPPISHCLPFLVPATMYAINNNLSIYMQAHMDPTTYQILGNMKVATTAILYRLIINRKLNTIQWVSLAVLSAAGMFDGYGALWSKGDNWSGSIHLTWTGLTMMIVYCWISGFAGVFTEYILKRHYETSLHVQNILLYIFGILINSVVWLVEESRARNNGQNEDPSLLKGFTVYTWIIIITQAFNGLIMSAIMKHGSSIMRLFVISCAMLVTTVLSIIVFDLALNMYYIVAFVLVVFALYLYHGCTPGDAGSS